MNISVVDKWAGCMYSVAFGFGGEDGYELRAEGFNENYGCLQPDVIRESANAKSFFENDRKIPVAELHGIGRFDDPDVIEALEKSCEKCRYFQRR